ncbi:MAG: FAD-dependent oxidoreductase [Balneolaceae bacterium]
MSQNRRQFLANTGKWVTGAAGIGSMGWNVAPTHAAGAPSTRDSGTLNIPHQSTSSLGEELRADLVIIGGGTGGCAAALSALKQGLTVIMTEPTDWIGGQLTSQGVPPDENPWIEEFGGTESYQTYRRQVRDYYKQNYPLTPESWENPYLNPGDGWVSSICHEPRVSLAVLENMFAPYLANQQLILLLEYRPVEAGLRGDEITWVDVEQLGTDVRRRLQSPTFIDATETGDLIKLANVEYVVGSEGRDVTGEPNTPIETNPANMQAFTLCFVIDHINGENHVIEKPEEYAFWRDYTPELTPAWPGPLFSFTYTHPGTLEPRTLPFEPESQDGWWAYRQMINRHNFEQGFFRGNLTCMNWPQNDYLLGNIIDEPEEVIQEHLNRSYQQSLSLFYWLQTEAPRSDGGQGYPGLRIRGDVLGTEHGMAKHPYIRESRRIKARFTVKEQHVGTEARMAETGLSREDVRAARFEDSVGIGAYRIDLHPSTGLFNYIDISSLPFQIPLGALIPQRVRNLIPASKNLGTTHITNGCYRLHPVEWNIGEAAGALAAYCKLRRSEPHQVYESREETRSFQRMLTNMGVRLEWPSDKIHAL